MAISFLNSIYPKLQKQIIHRDPNPSNIIVTEEKWGFVDFELSEKIYVYLTHVMLQPRFCQKVLKKEMKRKCRENAEMDRYLSKYSSRI